VNQEQTYHIDTTPEEDELFQDTPSTTEAIIPEKKAFTKIFCIVLSLHVAVAGIITFSATCSNANAAPEKSQNTSSVAETFKSTNSLATSNATAPKTDKTNPTEVPKPTPLVTPVSPKKAQSTTSAKKSPIATPLNPTNVLYTKEYVVKQGDSVYSISKKYKLSVDRLIKLNNIKDVNKIQIGQSLKFM
jgi:LysM repeat protein